MNNIAVIAFMGTLIGLPVVLTKLFRWMWRNPDKVG